MGMPEYVQKEETKPEQPEQNDAPPPIITAPEEAKPEELKSEQTKPKAPTPTPEGNKIPTNKE